MPVSDEVALDSAARSWSELDRVFGSAATIISNDAPTAEASAAADPPPGVGSDDANAASRSRTVLSVSMNDLRFFDHRADGVRADANQIDRRPGHDDRVHLLADLEAADAVVAIQRVRRIDRRADQRLFEGEPHAEAGERHGERHRRREAA